MLVGCFNGGPDSPNGRERDGNGRAYRYTVTRQADARALASGCSGTTYPNPTIRAQIGDRLVYDILEENVIKTDVAGPDDWWCNDQELLRRSSAALVDNLEFWGMPTHAPIRVERAEAIPADRNQEPTLPYLMKGKDFDFGSKSSTSVRSRSPREPPARFKG
jgi:hypothetical protein